MKQYITKLLIMGILLLGVSNPINVNSVENQKTNTKGTVSFTGVYEPIGTPDPTPPESMVRPPIAEVAKPGGTLPQTNDTSSSRSIWFGILIISFVFLLWKRKNKQI